MLAVITSDLHGRLDILRAILSAHTDADLYLDAGDSSRRPAELEPFITVKGNCDLHGSERFRVIEFGSARILLFHGDRADLSDEGLYMLALRHRCEIVIHGHTHVPKYHCFRGVQIICPGSPAFPRGGSKPTYALLRGDPVEKVEFITVSHEKS
jgi:putative phosphoesterase